MRPRAAGLLALGLACTAAPPSVSPVPATGGGQPAATTQDTTAGMIPPGFGSLRQDDIAIRLEPPNLVVKLIPLDESIIRVLAPDSYRYFHDLLESRRADVRRSAAVHGLRDEHVWYVEFIALATDARFVPTDVTVTSSGRDFRPLEVFPLTRGFGQQRVQPHEYQKALYLFDDAVNAAQPLTVTMATQRNSDWEIILRSIERERAQIRARAASKPPNGAGR